MKKKPVHDMGSTSDLLDVRLQNIETERDGASSTLMQQAQRMVKRSRLELVSGQIGDNVAVPIPLVDRGRGDPRNILGISHVQRGVLGVPKPLPFCPHDKKCAFRA